MKFQPNTFKDFGIYIGYGKQLYLLPELGLVRTQKT